MSWSKVKKPLEKPVKWWYHKILCEIGYKLFGSSTMYYKHLNKLADTGYNLYGEYFPQSKRWKK